MLTELRLQNFKANGKESGFTPARVVLQDFTRVQANLADAFISAIHARENGENRNTQLIIESHSEHFLNRLQRRIAEGEVTPDEVEVYFVTRNRQGAHLEPLRLNEYGDIENWPDDFFGNDMEDITQRALAAARKRKARKAQEADFMYEKDRQEELDKNEQALRETRAEVSQTYMEMFNNLLTDMEILEKRYQKYVPQEYLKEVLDKYR